MGKKNVKLNDEQREDIINFLRYCERGIDRERAKIDDLKRKVKSNKLTSDELDMLENSSARRIYNIKKRRFDQYKKIKNLEMKLNYDKLDELTEDEREDLERWKLFERYVCGIELSDKESLRRYIDSELEMLGLKIISNKERDL